MQRISSENVTTDRVIFEFIVLPAFFTAALPVSMSVIESKSSFNPSLRSNLSLNLKLFKSV